MRMPDPDRDVLSKRTESIAADVDPVSAEELRQSLI